MTNKISSFTVLRHRLSKKLTSSALHSSKNASQAKIEKLLQPHLTLFLVTGLVVLVLFLFQSDKGLELSDEGFLWYGSQRVLSGEMPGLDFLAYDPARYLFSAAIMFAVGDMGIITQRFAMAIFQWLGLFIGASLLLHHHQTQSRTPVQIRDLVFLGLYIVLFALWMIPRYKIFDITQSIILVAGFYILINKPSFRNALIAGVCVGLSAFMGRNHGVYGLVAAALIVLYLITIYRYADWTAIISGGVLGVIIGYSPMLFLFLLRPGLFQSIIDHIVFMVECGCTNLPLPVPWPWRADSLRGFFEGLVFLAIPVFIIYGVITTITKRQRSPLFIAALACAIPYTHYSFERAGTIHLALGIFPLLLAMGVLLFGTSRRIFIVVFLALVSAVITENEHQTWFPRTDNNKYTQLQVGDDVLYLKSEKAATLKLFERLQSEYRVKENETFGAFPRWPTVYAAFQKKSPLFDIYALLPMSDEKQKGEVLRLKEHLPAFIVISNEIVDGKDELAFENTRPVIFRFIKENYTKINPEENTTGESVDIFVKTAWPGL